MNNDDKFALWIAGLTLRSSGREVEAITLDDLVKRVEQTGDLAIELAEMRRFDRKGGDFGAEIVAAMVIPLLIEAGKQLWVAYLKKLTDKAAGALTDVTVEQVKAFTQIHWGSSTDDSRADFSEILRAEAIKQGLSDTQTDALITALHQQGMTRAIRPS